MICIYFSHPMCCLSLLLIVFFDTQSFLSFGVVQISFFSFVACMFGVFSRKSSAKSNTMKLFRNDFLQKFYNFSYSISFFDLFWVSFCLWYKVSVQLHSFVSGYIEDMYIERMCVCACISLYRIYTYILYIHHWFSLFMIIMSCNSLCEYWIREYRITALEEIWS